MSILRLTALPLAAALCVASAATADAPVVTAGESGFSLGTPDGAWALRIKGQLQVDGRFIFGDGDGNVADSFLLRSARPVVEATLFRWADVRLVPDFGNGKAVIQDAYLKLHPWPWLQLAAGKMKVPFGLERLQSETATYLAERGLPTALAPNRDIGLVLSSELLDGALTLELGVFDGSADNTVVEGDTSDGKDLVARVFAFPFRALNLTGLNGLGLGVAVTYGEETADGAEPSKYASSSTQTYFKFRTAADDGTGAVLPDGERLRVAGQLQYNVAWFGLLGEVAWGRHRFIRDADAITAQDLAWQAAMDFALFGSDSRFDGSRPTAPVTAGGPGAFHLAVRFGQLWLDDDLFPTYADPAKSAESARNVGVALSWWATRNLRAIVDYSRTDFDGGAANDGDRPAEDVLTVRLQAAF